VFKTLRTLVNFLIPPRIDWENVVRILAVKEDVLGYDSISLHIEFEHRDEPLIVQQETIGYRRIVSAVHQQLPGVDPDWYANMMQDPIHCYERVLYERA
jgi:hypothetical protein